MKGDEQCGQYLLGFEAKIYHIMLLIQNDASPVYGA